MHNIIKILPSLAGAICVALGLPLYANMLWVIGNPILIISNYKNNDKGQALYFTVCSILAAYGVWNLS